MKSINTSKSHEKLSLPNPLFAFDSLLYKNCHDTVGTKSRLHNIFCSKIVTLCQIWLSSTFILCKKRFVKAQSNPLLIGCIVLWKRTNNKNNEEKVDVHSGIKPIGELQLKAKVYELKEHISLWEQKQKKTWHDRVGADIIWLIETIMHLGEVLKTTILIL